MKKVKGKSTRISGEERRIQIIDAALEQFAQNGFSGTRAREIAQQAGISQTLIFQHFQTMEGLYREALKELFGRHLIVPDIGKIMADKNDFGVFRSLAIHIVERNKQDSKLIRLGIYTALDGLHLSEIVHDSDNIGPPLHEILNRYLRERIEDGVFKGINSEIAAKLFMDAVYMYVLDKDTSLSGPPLNISDEEAVDTLVRIFLDGIRA